jgi:hypothetical protein
MQRAELTQHVALMTDYIISNFYTPATALYRMQRAQLAVQLQTSQHGMCTQADIHEQCLCAGILAQRHI